jgi:hypothetical protein
MIVTFIPPKTKIYLLNNLTNWWRPVVVKNECMTHEIVRDTRECGWNVQGFTVYKIGACYMAIENDKPLIRHYIPW